MTMLIVVAVTLVALTGCGTGGNADIGKTLADDYYQSFSASDFDACASMFHESLIDNVGGRDALFSIYAQMEDAWGNVVNYDIKQTGFYSSNGESDIDLSIKVEYSSGLTATDTMTIWVQKDGSASITAISTGDPQ